MYKNSRILDLKNCWRLVRKYRKILNIYFLNRVEENKKKNGSNFAVFFSIQSFYHNGAYYRPRVRVWRRYFMSSFFFHFIFLSKKKIPIFILKNFIFFIHPTSIFFYVLKSAGCNDNVIYRYLGNK